MRARLRSRRGFSLIEALASFAILAISLGQLLNGVSGGVRNEARADFLLRAARQGASQLDALGVDGPIPFGESSGRYPDGLFWFLSVTSGPPTTSPAGAPKVGSFQARLIVKKSSGYGDTFTLATVKLTTDLPRPMQ